MTALGFTFSGPPSVSSVSTPSTTTSAWTAPLARPVQMAPQFSFGGTAAVSPPNNADEDYHEVLQNAPATCDVATLKKGNIIASNPNGSGEFIANTAFEVSSTTFKWTIENYSFCPLSVGEGLFSPKFSCKDSQWRLVLYPNGKSKEFKSFVSCFLLKFSGENRPMLVKRKVSILNKSGAAANTVSKESVYKKNGDSYGKLNWVSKADLLSNEELLPDGKLTVLCTLEVGTMSGAEENKREVSLVLPPTSDAIRFLQNLSSDLESLCSSAKPTFTDIELQCQGMTIAAHKGVLSSRSPVFLSKLDDDTDGLEVTDVDYDILKELIFFLYTGKTRVLTNFNVALKLFEASYLYKIKDLQSVCSDFLKSSLEIENAAEIWSLADHNDNERLKNHVVQFICDHSEEVMQTQTWLNVLQKKPTLASDILLAMHRK